MAAALPFLAFAQPAGVPSFQKQVQPLLEQYCYDCHGDGAKKGNLALDEIAANPTAPEHRETWSQALKYLRAGLMPPAKKPHPSAEDQDLISLWIKRSAFGIDPANPDPGRVTVRRLNRIEYHNTIRDLLDVDFDTQTEFPPDDTGYGFDNIGDVLTLSPMLLEKYLAAANKIINETVPTVSAVAPERYLEGRRFEGAESSGGSRHRSGGLALSYYAKSAVSNTFNAKYAGHYELEIEMVVNEHFVDDVFDYNKCRVSFFSDGQELLKQEYSWEGGKHYHYKLEQNWAAGSHQLSFQLEPLTPGEKQTRGLSMQIMGVKVRGPSEREHWIKPANYDRFFPQPVSHEASSRKAYARRLLGEFATRAFRRPADNRTIERLAALAESIYTQPGKTFEAGIAQAMVAVLASPRFLFREEAPLALASSELYPEVDEYALASRLSYFLWSSMPDRELMRLAEQNGLRKNLSAQVDRMLRDDRSRAFIRNFTGQWLRARDIESVPIESRAVLSREQKFDPEWEKRRKRFRELNIKSDDQLTSEEKEELAQIRAAFRSAFGRAPRVELSPELRAAMRHETERTFEYVLRENRPLLELIDCDYTFLNEELARFYGIDGVRGDDLRLVKLPPGSPRGGIITEGTVLVTTSNPTRTSPVKRGLFLLDNIFGTPPPPPPPDIPPLEDAAKGMTNRVPTLRETLAIHRENALCSSCHNRMDPLGLALENFNAMGMWRTNEYGQDIDATGRLITGEPFQSVSELKHIVVKNHYRDFYRTLAEKLLTYALGRGLEYYDTETVDQIVERLEKSNGKPSELIAGIVECAPFQKMRRHEVKTASVENGLKHN